MVAKLLGDWVVRVLVYWVSGLPGCRVLINPIQSREKESDSQWNLCSRKGFLSSGIWATKLVWIVGKLQGVTWSRRRWHKLESQTDRVTTGIAQSRNLLVWLESTTSPGVSPINPKTRVPDDIRGSADRASGLFRLAARSSFDRADNRFCRCWTLRWGGRSPEIDLVYGLLAQEVLVPMFVGIGNVEIHGYTCRPKLHRIYQIQRMITIYIDI